MAWNPGIHRGPPQNGKPQSWDSNSAVPVHYPGDFPKPWRSWASALTAAWDGIGKTYSLCLPGERKLKRDFTLKLGLWRATYTLNIRANEKQIPLWVRGKERNLRGGGRLPWEFVATSHSYRFAGRIHATGAGKGFEWTFWFIAVLGWFAPSLLVKANIHPL